MATAKELMADYMRTRPTGQEVSKEANTVQPLNVQNAPLKVEVFPEDTDIVQAPETGQDKAFLSNPGKPTPVTNLEDAFGDLFKTSKSGTGEEELLRIASQFSLQVTARQMRCLVYLMHRAERSEARGWAQEAYLLRLFVQKWLEYKQNNNSDVFVMKALEHISLRHYINENSFKVNIEK